MIGIITEKPSARRNFAKALGGDSGTFNGEKYKLINLRGHLFEYVEPSKQVSEDLADKYSSWALGNLPWKYEDFKWKRSMAEGTRSLITEIKRELSGCSEIVVATDWDVVSGEGFLLAAEVLEETGLLKKSPIVSRMFFLDEQPTTIQKAFKERIAIENFKEFPEYRKSLFRSQWDFMSQQFTRVATSFCSRKLGIPRQGRLKSYITFLVGDAWEKIESHEEKFFFQNRFIDENGNNYISKEEPKYETEGECLKTKFSNSPIIVEGQRAKTSAPPKLFDMARLSATLAKSGYKVKQIRDCYQKMYEKGILSYPRTSDSTITKEQFKELVSLAPKIAALIGVDLSLLSYRKIRATHVKDGGSHGANRPGPNVPSSMSSLEAVYGKLGVKIYTILARSALSILAPDYEYIQEYGYVTDYPNFKGSVNIPKFAGWKEVLGNLDSDEMEYGKGLGKTANPIVYKGEYPKPKIPTMLWLSNIMEKNEVGTGSTRASTIGEISNEKSKYPLLVNDKGKLSLTPLGKASYTLIKGTNIASLDLTERVFKVMKSIGEPNELDPKSSLNEIGKLVLADIETMKANRSEAVKLFYENKDSAPQVERHPTKDSKDKEVSFKTEWNGHTFTEKEISALTNGKEVVIGPFKNNKGKDYWAKGKLDYNKFKGKTFYGFKVVEFLNKKP